MYNRFLLSILSLLAAVSGFAATRTVTSLNAGWTFSPQYDVTKRPVSQTVDVPHSWNLKDVFEGMRYDRSTYLYSRTLTKDASMQGKRVFLKFDGVNTYAEVAVNQRTVGSHKGGYTAFCLEITDALKDGENKVTVLASNAYRTDVAPLSGDFNMYGGIVRPVHLIVTGPDCISPLDHASCGIYVHQNQVDAQKADLTIETVLSLTKGTAGKSLRVSIIDEKNQVVAEQTSPVSGSVMKQQLTVNRPNLWDGRNNPALYRVRAELLADEAVVDCVEDVTGFRSFSVDVDKGFFLNGKYLDLHGVCRHEEGYGLGNLYNEQALRKDAQIIAEMGSTGVRFVHYPHSRYDVQQYDSLGIVLWYELNLAGPGGYASPGYIKNEAFEAGLMENLEEMIKQNYNSPAICFWSLCNELSFKYDEPATFLRKLNERAKQLDPQRLTTLAICYSQDGFQGITDVFGWNKYFGWYNSSGGIGEFMDNAKQEAGGIPVGVCEYGAAGSHLQHGFEKMVSNRVHLEEYQARVHEDNWMQMVKRPYLWCKFIWQYADNPSSIRDEGDMKGLNDKGMVSYDRSVRKDSYYFYKANWSSEPMVYIAARRYTPRVEALTDIKVYTNQPTVTLDVNGKKIGKAKKDSLGRAVFSNVTLKDGENTIEVRSGKLRDTCKWILDKNAIRSIDQKTNKSLDGAV